jgi:hypothetical protein
MQNFACVVPGGMQRFAHPPGPTRQRDGAESMAKQIDQLPKESTKALFAKWEALGMPGFWLDFYTAESGFELGSPEYTAAHEMGLAS